MANDNGAKNPSLLHLERLSGGFFCSDGGVQSGDEVLELSSSMRTKSADGSISVGLDPETFRKLVVGRFDAPSARCLDMSFVTPLFGIGPSRQTDMKRNAGYVDIDGRLLPLIISRMNPENPEHGETAPAKVIYVRVGGGPGADNITANSDSLIDYFEGHYLIDFYYTGHSFNVVHPDPSFELAYTQLSKFLVQLRSRNPQSRIVVLGESLGAVLSLEAIDKAAAITGASTPVVDKLALLSPPFGSLDRTAELLEPMILAQGNSEKKFAYRVRDLGERYNEYGELAFLNSMDFFRRFYEESQGSIDLIERARKASRFVPILVFYGSDDVRIDLEKARDFEAEALENVSVTRIEGMDHQPFRLAEIGLIREELGFFVDE